MNASGLRELPFVLNGEPFTICVGYDSFCIKTFDGRTMIGLSSMYTAFLKKMNNAYQLGIPHECFARHCRKPQKLATMVIERLEKILLQ